MNDNLSRTIEEIKNIIVEKFNPQKIILFGSCAREEADPRDIDLFIVSESNLRIDIRGQKVREMLPFRYPIDVVVYTPEEYEKHEGIKGSFLNSILNGGKAIYEHDRMV